MEISLKPNLFFKSGTMEPNVVMAIPKNKIPRQADQKINFLLYIFQNKIFPSPMERNWGEVLLLHRSFSHLRNGHTNLLSYLDPISVGNHF